MRNFFTWSKKAVRQLPVFLLLSLPALLLTQCKNESKTADEKQMSGEGSFAGSDTMYLNTLVIDSNAMNYWISKGWTTGAKKIKVILLQFYSAKAGRMNDSMKLIGYPGKDLASVGSRPPIYLNIDPSMTRVPISDSVIMANNIGDIESWDIFNPDGSRKYDFIRLKPAINAGHYIYFKLELVKIGMATLSVANGTNPCPPCQYCIPACLPEL